MGNEGKYYTNFSAIGTFFEDYTILTEFFIPAECNEDIWIRVFFLIHQNGGKLWNPPKFTEKGIYLIPITFQENAGREACCKQVEVLISNSIPKSLISFTKHPDGNVSISMNVKRLFIVLQEAIEKMQPVMDYIDCNGGWCDLETGVFNGYDSLENAFDAGSLSLEVLESYKFIKNFMGMYAIGAQFMEGKRFTDNPHE